METPGIDEDEFTRLSDFHPDRVDLVKNAANGTRFLIAKQDATAGVLDPEFVRSLIAKSPEEAPVPQTTEAGETTLPNGIVIKGSPADMAAFLNAANARPAPSPADMAKAKNDTADREKKASTGAAMPDGSYPIADKGDLGKAIHAVGRGGSGHDAIRKHIISRARSLGASAEIPDNWNPDGSLKGDVSKEADVPDAVAKDIMDAAGDGVPIDDGLDGMDPTTPFAAPGDEMDLPGDPTDPGSPAWEGIDAATAHKWLAIAARLKNALLLLAEREMLEAASADPSDAENAFSLEDAACAVDYAIGNLAVFASGEKAEAEIGAECEEMCKALAAFDLAPLGVIEGLTAVAKSGRVLSSANEAAIRSATESLQKVLASLPEAPVAKQKEAAVADTDKAADVAKERSPEEQAKDKGPVAATGTTAMGEARTTGPAASLPADGPQAALPGDTGRQVVKSAGLPVVVYDRGGRQCITRPDAILDPVAKADDGGDGKVTMQAVFDENGNLVGIVDPADITPVAGAGGDSGGDAQPEAGPAAAAPDDDNPQPPAEAGTPADAVGKAADENVITIGRDALKGIAREAARDALEAQGAAHQEVVAKMAADNGELREELKVVKERLVTVENSPAAPGVFTNGQVPPKDARPVPSQAQLRGQDAGQPVDVTKAVELRKALYEGSGPEQAKAFHEMEGMAIAGLQAIRMRGQQSPAVPA